MSTLVPSSDLIGEIYEASSRPAHWQSVLSMIAEIIQADSAMLLYRDFENPASDINFVHTTQTPEECAQMVEEYENYYHRLDPMWKLVGDNVQTGIAISDSQLGLTREEYEAHCPEEYLENYMRKYDRWFVGGSYLFHDEDKALVVAVQRGINSQPWKDEEMAYLTQLSPHIQRSFRIHKEFIDLRTSSMHLKACINRLLMGLIIVNPNGRIAFINELAKSILSANPVLQDNNGILKASPVRNDNRLQGLIEDICNTDLQSIEDPSDVIVAISMKTDDRSSPLPMLITPVFHDNNQHDQRNSVAIFFAEPARSQQYSQDVISEFYGLTKAEAGVAIAVSNGYTIAEYAEKNGITMNTVRTQIKHIFQKMNISRQAELVKILLQTPNISLEENSPFTPSRIQ